MCTRQNVNLYIILQVLKRFPECLFCFQVDNSSYFISGFGAENLYTPMYIYHENAVRFFNLILGSYDAYFK